MVTSTTNFSEDPDNSTPQIPSSDQQTASETNPEQIVLTPELITDISNRVGANEIFLEVKSNKLRGWIRDGAKLYIQYHCDGDASSLTTKLDNLKFDQYDFFEETRIAATFRGKPDLPILNIISTLAREELIKTGIQVKTKSLIES